MALREALGRVEALEDVPFLGDLVAAMEAIPPRPIRFHTPTFKAYQSSELKACGKGSWPAFSITGPTCKLMCDHCRAKVLEPMIPATTPAMLWEGANRAIEEGAQGILLTGGSNRRNEVEYAPFYPVIRRLKDAHPGFRIAAHTALMDRAQAKAMEDAGVDVAMMDVIGAQETITQVYHLKRSVEDFELTLEALVETSMKVVPHIVLGLHYGRFLGERRALEMVRRHRPDALVLVVAMPFYAPKNRPFAVPDPHEVGRFFLKTRRAFGDLPLRLGCARPPGVAKALIDAYAVMAGIDAIAHPAEGVVELAARLGREVKVSSSCCSIAVADDGGVSVELEAILRETPGRLGDIPVVAG